MQSTGPNANRAPIICLLESSLLEYGTSNRPCWTDNSNINRSNSIFYTSYDALLLMQSAIYNLQELESKPFNIEPSITSLALVRVHWLYPSRHFYEGHANLTTDTNSFLTHPQPGFPVAETVDLACSNIPIHRNFVWLSIVRAETFSNCSQHTGVLLSGEGWFGGCV